MLFPQLFCKHKWSIHQKINKVERVFVSNVIGDGYNPTDARRDFTREVLICEKCGKIKKIEY